MPECRISKEDVFSAAMIFGGYQATFTVADFTDFLHSQQHDLHQEAVDELLTDFVGEGRLRQVGPGVFARLAGSVQ